MKKLLFLTCAAITLATAAYAQVKLPVEAKSQITVLVDLSETWLNPASETSNRHALNAVADTIAGLLPKLKAPVNIRYLEIGANSMSRRPICEARYFPNIFRISSTAGEYADIPKTVEFFRSDCSKLIFMRKPAPLTDITGALNTVSRVAENEAPNYSALIILSDFQEERGRGKTGTIGRLKGVRSLLLYRVLNSDRDNPYQLDERVKKWKGLLRAAGAVTTDAVDDVIVDPGTMTRLLLR